MRKGVILFVAVLALALLMGACTTTTNQLPGRDLPLAAANYTILGETTGEASHSTFLRFITVGAEHTYVNDTGGSDLGNLFSWGGVDLAKSNALYKALAQVPDADELINEKYVITEEDYRFFRKINVKVTATAIQYKDGPVVMK
ncbi:MAG: hypothetical protein LBT33_09430 [Spirochaetia bacterium]|jgi:hypothetical protein|nr:hypothetical protein [Spirochaetia bacterium]